MEETQEERLGNGRQGSSSSSIEVEDVGHGGIGGESSEFAAEDVAGGTQGSSSDNRHFSRVNTLPPVGKTHCGEPVPEFDEVKLERSKTERQRHSSILPSEAAQIFDNKIPVQKKLKLLNRIATVKDDGTVELKVPTDIEPKAFGVGSEDSYTEAGSEENNDTNDFHYIRPLQIVMLIVGTRGDVQPFVAIGKKLQDYGHRVRLATHANFKDFVLTAGLEFYALGGDPKVLAGYMVKNKGFLPSGPSEIPIQRNQMKEIIYSLIPACSDADDSGVPFKADAIIANPPAYGQIDDLSSCLVRMFSDFLLSFLSGYALYENSLLIQG